MLIRDQSHTNISKQTRLLVGVDVGSAQWPGLDHMNGSEIEEHRE